MLTDRQWADFEEKRDADFSYQIPGAGRFRVNAHYQRKSVAIAFRIINDKVRAIEELFLPGIVERLTHLPRGLILVTGPTGSGKSTTLAAMIDSINRREYGHIITLEDPIEYAFVSAKSCIEQREMGSDCPSFASGLRHALALPRSDVILGRRNAAIWKPCWLRHHRRRNRPLGLQHAAHGERPANHRAYHRRLSV